MNKQEKINAIHKLLDAPSTEVKYYELLEDMENRLSRKLQLYKK